VVVDVPLVTIGGGLGSFALVDVLRVAGVPAEKIRVISPSREPDANFLRRCRTSGLTDTDRLRSDSSARIDNPWGFPGYALQQACRTRRVRPLLQVLTEPVLSEYYTPTVGQVHSGLRREADRIRWDSMVVDGVATEIRREDDGGYVVTVEPLTGPPLAYRSRFVHLAPGYAGPRLTAETRRFRDHNPSNDRLVHAYEPHEHVYATLAGRSGTVLVRGAGIAASRILQRLAEDRRTTGNDIRVWHLARHPRSRDPRPARLAKYDGTAFVCQAFNFPKAAFGGQLRDRTLRLPDAERAEEIRLLGGTSTPHRRLWARQLRRGLAEGWYRPITGEMTDLVPTESGIAAYVRPPDSATVILRADFVIDATGLDPDIHRHPILASLDDLGVTTNQLGGLAIGPDFDVQGADSGTGRVYASGVIIAGGHLAPADSFAGLQLAALAIADSLTRHGLGEPLRFSRSVAQWWRWMRNRPL
jgi:hypothetical protein